MRLTIESHKDKHVWKFVTKTWLLRKEDTPDEAAYLLYSMQLNGNDDDDDDDNDVNVDV